MRERMGRVNERDEEEREVRIKKKKKQIKTCYNIFERHNKLQIPQS